MIAYDSSKKDYYEWNVKCTKILKDGKSILNVEYLAKVEGRYFQINLQLLSEQKDQKSDSFKKVIIDTAHLAHRLITSSNSPEIVTVSYENRVVSKQITNWTGQDSSTSCEEQNDVDDQIVSFLAKRRFSSEPSEIKRVATVYHQTVEDQVLQKDIFELLGALPSIDMTETQVQEVVHEFMTIKDPVKRSAIVIDINKTYSFRTYAGYQKNWIACMPLCIRACRELPEGNEVSMATWGPILDLVKTYEQLLQTLEAWNTDVHALDQKWNTILEFAAQDHRQKYSHIGRELLKTQSIDEYNYIKLFEIACALEDFETVNKIVSFAALDNNRSVPTNSCLVKAIEKKRVALAEVLIKTGRFEDLNHPSAYQKRSLVGFAIYKGNLAIARMALTVPGIDVNSKNFGLTPLEGAIYAKDDKIVEALLQVPDIDIEIDDSLFIRIILSRNKEIENQKIAELFLSHPKMTWNMVSKYLNQYPALALDENITLVKARFPEETEEWLVNHPEIEISTLIIEENFDLAKKKLDTVLESNPTFPIITFMKGDPMVKSFLTGPYKESLCNWLVKHHVLETLKPEEQCFMLELLDPNFFQYISAGQVGNRLLDRSLGPQGMEMIVDYLRNKPDPSLPKEDCVSVCADYVAFEQALKQIAENPEIKDGYSHYFAVLETENNPRLYGTHVTPIFFKKVSGKWQVVITDSTTDNSNRTLHTGPLIERINKAERANPGFVVERIHASIFWRQVDDSTCPIFALRDLVHFYRHGDEYLQTLSTNQKEQIHYFSDFPPELMKTNQSVKEIKEYAEERRRKGLRVTMTTRKPPGTESILDNLNRHAEVVKDGSMKIHNELAEQRSKKYRQIILNRLIDRFSKTVSLIA